MDSERIRLLLVEDDEDDQVLTRAILADGFGDRCGVDWAPTFGLGLERLTTGSYDVALLDYNLGSETGIELLRAAMARGCRTPIIMLTGQVDRATDLDAMHAGAADYLVKGRVTGEMLERAIRYARERHRLLEEIRSLSLIDQLTGLSNRRAFFTAGTATPAARATWLALCPRLRRRRWLEGCERHARSRSRRRPAGGCCARVVWGLPADRSRRTVRRR
jgi:DNA-binding response OmpR family regulator